MDMNKFPPPTVQKQEYLSKATTKDLNSLVKL